MRLRITLCAGVSLLAAITIHATQQTSSAKVMLEAAKKKQLIDGDLKGAIEQYKAIVSKFKNDRASVADALIRMADLYQRLGDAESRKIYEQVVRDYAEQVEAVAVARKFLARDVATDMQVIMSNRRLWRPQSFSSDFITGATISPDGRFLSYTDWSTGDLAIHEFATGRDRHLTNSGYPNWAEQSAISRDGKQVAYSLFRSEASRYELRITSLEGSTLPQSRLLFDNPDVEWLMPCDWAPNGDSLAIQLKRKDGAAQIGLVSIRDGSLRVLKSVDWLGTKEMFFSPDGKYLGLDLPAEQGADERRNVFMLAVDGSRQIPIAASASNDTMMGWAPDGKRLLFASDRGGTAGLWAISIENGTPQSLPEFLKSDISRASLGVSASGSLYTGLTVGDRDIRVASVDFDSGKVTREPVRPIQSFVGVNVDPSWSPDGKHLVYRSQRSEVGTNDVVGILSLETGQVRVLKPQMFYFENPRWTPDGRSLIVNGRDLKGRRGPVQVDLETGEVTPFVPTGLTSPDGERQYYRKSVGTEGFAIVERDVATAKEREIIRHKNSNSTFSRDGQFAAMTYNDDPKASWPNAVSLVPLDGGRPRDLLRGSELLDRGVNWMPDSRAFLVTKRLNDSNDQSELWLVPIDGNPPRKIDIGTTHFAGFSFKLHPDGRQIAYVSGERNQEVWVLENFLPAVKPSK